MRGRSFGNKNVQNILHDVVHRHCQSVLYFQNLMPFHSTRLHVMPLTLIGKIWTSLRRLSWNTKNYVQICYTELNTNRANAECKRRNPFIPISYVWLSLRRFTGNSQLLSKFLWTSLLPSFIQSEEKYKIRAKFYFRLEINYAFHFICFHKTHNSPMALSGDILYQISAKWPKTWKVQV